MSRQQHANGLLALWRLPGQLHLSNLLHGGCELDGLGVHLSLMPRTDSKLARFASTLISIYSAVGEIRVLALV